MSRPENIRLKIVRPKKKDYLTKICSSFTKNFNKKYST